MSLVTSIKEYKFDNANAFIFCYFMEFDSNCQNI